MLQLAKTESKKEMSLKKRKKLNNTQLYKIKSITDRLYTNYSQTKCLHHHKLINKTEPKNISNNSIKKNKIPTSTSNMSFKSKNNKNTKKIPSSTSPIKKNQNKKIFSYLNSNNLKKYDSVRNKNNAYNIKNNEKNSFNNILNFQSQKRVNTEGNQILTNIKDDKLKKLISMSSDIFNLNETATNLIRRTGFSPKLPDYFKNLYKKENIDNNLQENSMSHLDNNYYSILTNKVLEKGKPKQKYYKYNKINTFNRTLYNPNETNSFKSKGQSNIESVKYDIISTKKSNLFDKYNNISSIRASTSRIEDYEIIVPKNYNKSNIYKLKNIFTSNGVHVFDIKEDGDLISGQKGKFKIKVRLNEQNEKDNNKMINKASNKLSNMDVKLKRDIINWRKKRTDITGYGWEEEMKNGLY